MPANHRTRLCPAEQIVSFFSDFVCVCHEQSCFCIARCQVQIGDLNLTGAKIDSFRSAIWFRSAILIPNATLSLTLPDLNLTIVPSIPCLVSGRRSEPIIILLYQQGLQTCIQMNLYISLCVCLSIVPHYLRALTPLVGIIVARNLPCSGYS